MGLCDCLVGPKLPDDDVPTTVRSGSSRRPEVQASNSSSRQRQRAVQPPPSNGRHLPKRSKQYPERDPLAQMQNSRYRKVADLNDGTSGFVQLAEDVHTQQLVAIKFLPRGKKLIKDADREICNLRLCCMHPYIIKFKEAFLTDQNLAIVSEYASAGDLADFIEARRSQGSRTPRGLPEAHARQLFQQLMVAVDFCHQKGIVNRDLKLENVLLTVDKPNMDKAIVELPNVRLCDFGFSKDEAVDSICKTACGTPEYVAPEVLITNQYSGRAADIWSAGVVLYVMLTGQFPFKPAAGSETVTQQNKLKAIFPRIVNAQFDRPTWVSQSSCDLLEGMLQPDLKRRFSLANVLAHPWFTEGLPASLLDTNANLLKVSDMLLTSVAPQTEEEILSIVTEAMDLPRRRKGSAPLGSRRSQPPSLPPLQEQRTPQHSPALEHSPASSRSTRAPPPPSHLLSAIPGRWHMDPAAQPDYQPRANSHYQTHHHQQRQQPQQQHQVNGVSHKHQQQQLPRSRDQHRQQQQLQQDDAFRTFSIASSSESASSVHSRRRRSAGLKSRSAGSVEHLSSPGSSYDDLFADGNVMSSMNGNGRAPKQAPPILADAGWSVSDQPPQRPPRRATSATGFPGGAPREYGGQRGSYRPAPPVNSHGAGDSAIAPGGPSQMNGGSMRASPYANGGGPSSYEDRLYPLGGAGSKPLKGSMWAEQNRPQRADSWGRGQQHLAPQSSAASQPSLAGAWNLDWQRSAASQASLLHGMQPRGGRLPPAGGSLLPPSYEHGDEGRAAAARRRLASPDWVRQEVARNKWSPMRDKQASTVGSLTDSEDLMDDRHLEEEQRRSNGPTHDVLSPSRSKHGLRPQGSHGSAASRILDSPSASAASSLPYPPTPARIRTHVGTSRY